MHPLWGRRWLEGKGRMTSRKLVTLCFWIPPRVTLWCSVYKNPLHGTFKRCTCLWEFYHSVRSSQREGGPASALSEINEPWKATGRPCRWRVSPGDSHGAHALWNRAAGADRQQGLLPTKERRNETYWKLKTEYLTGKIFSNTFNTGF